MNARFSRRLLLGSAVLGPLLAACDGDQADASTPPPISYGRDTCDRCGMIISDDRYAAGLVAEDGTAELFDDVGEMVQSLRESGLQGRRAWAHDWTSRAWIDATSAIYVQGAKETTPMGTGIVAFGARERAEAYSAEKDGLILAWNELTGREEQL